MTPRSDPARSSCSRSIAAATLWRVARRSSRRIVQTTTAASAMMTPSHTMKGVPRGNPIHRAPPSAEAAAASSAQVAPMASAAPAST
jgi:hypothetical protein